MARKFVGVAGDEWEQIICEDCAQIFINQNDIPQVLPGFWWLVDPNTDVTYSVEETESTEACATCKRYDEGLTW